MSQILGIIGGMGPRATVAFEQLLFDRIPGSDQAMPTVITINRGSIADRSAFIQGLGRDPVPAIQQSIDQLESLGATLLCMPCNTASTAPIAERLKSSVSLLSLPLLVSNRIADHRLRKVLILATKGTIATGTYQQFCNQAGAQFVVPSLAMQSYVDQCIQLVKQGHLQTARTAAQQLSRYALANDCDAVLLGCTELPLLATELVPATCLALDTLAILADGCIQYLQTRQGAYNEQRPIYV